MRQSTERMCRIKAEAESRQHGGGDAAEQRQKYREVKAEKLSNFSDFYECSFPTDVKMAASLTIEAIPPFLYPFLYMDAEIIWSLFPQQLQQVQLSLQSPEQRCEPG